MRDQLGIEIRKILEGLAVELWRPRIIAVQLCTKHMIPALRKSEEYGFWHYCGYETCRDLTTEIIGRLADPTTEESEDAPRLPGFTHIQTHYTVKRNLDGGRFGKREIVGVPVDDLTDDETEAIVRRMRTSGNAILDHADELERYKGLRRAA